MDSRISAGPENMKERLKASYDAIAPTYNKWTMPHSQLRMKYLGKALDFLSLSDKSNEVAFLELGCGCGLPVTEKLLSFPGAKITANDISESQITLAREHLLKDVDTGTAARLNLVQGDMNALRFEKASLDLVAAFYSIIHLPRTEQVELLGRITEWLKPGGYFVANFSKEEAETVVHENWLHEKGWMFWSGWGKDKSLQEIKKVGLEVVVADESEDVVDASFLWVIAKRP
ncbi:S-adenosyl-L-methionine-dependent methyltransferase [Xylariaceae sp. FL0255]|nr:S-adenosyl-L-methionine-dependent methyltransferase [Xylariaceae sp. FL0255]